MGCSKSNTVNIRQLALRSLVKGHVFAYWSWSLKIVLYLKVRRTVILFINKTTLTMKFSAALTLLLLTGTTNAFVNEQFASPSTRTFLGSTSTELSERKAFMTGNWKLNPQTKVRVIKSVVSCRVALFLVWFGLVWFLFIGSPSRVLEIRVSNISYID